MQQSRAALLRVLLQRGGLLTDGAQGLSFAPAAASLQAALHTAPPAPKWLPNASQQSEQNTRISALAAMTGGLAAYALFQPQAEALVAEPEPAGAEPSGKERLAPADVYKLPTERLRGVPKEVILYQYDVCPFCCKVKAVLDYYRIPYRCVEVGPLMKTELKWSEYKKVPVAMMDGEVLVDSSAIISRIAAETDAEAAAEQPPPKQGWFSRGKPAQPAAKTSHTGEEDRWRRWVDARLVRVLTINIYRNRAESFQTFDYITQQGNFSWLEREVGRVLGAATMWMVSGRLRKKYGIEGEAREELYSCADAWLAALDGRQFLGGDKPNLADLSVFGAIRSVTSTDTFMDLMHNTAIGGWYEHMMGAVGESTRLPSYD